MTGHGTTESRTGTKRDVFKWKLPGTFKVQSKIGDWLKAKKRTKYAKPPIVPVQIKVRKQTRVEDWLRPMRNRGVAVKDTPRSVSKSWRDKSTTKQDERRIKGVHKDKGLCGKEVQVEDCLCPTRNSGGSVKKTPCSASNKSSDKSIAKQEGRSEKAVNKDVEARPTNVEAGAGKSVAHKSTKAVNFDMELYLSTTELRSLTERERKFMEEMFQKMAVHLNHAFWLLGRAISGRSPLREMRRKLGVVEETAVKRHRNVECSVTVMNEHLERVNEKIKKSYLEVVCVYCRYEDGYHVVLHDTTGYIWDGVDVETVGEEGMRVFYCIRKIIMETQGLVSTSMVIRQVAWEKLLHEKEVESLVIALCDLRLLGMGTYREKSGRMWLGPRPLYGDPTVKMWGEKKGLYDVSVYSDDSDFE